MDPDPGGPKTSGSGGSGSGFGSGSATLVPAANKMRLQYNTVPWGDARRGNA
jgi:hypothetical protein